MHDGRKEFGLWILDVVDCRGVAWVASVVTAPTAVPSGAATTRDENGFAAAIFDGRPQEATNI
jgi:hypothetical protein